MLCHTCTTILVIIKYRKIYHCSIKEHNGKMTLNNFFPLFLTQSLLEKMSLAVDGSSHRETHKWTMCCELEILELSVLNGMSLFNPFPKSLGNYIEEGAEILSKSEGKYDKKEKVSSTHNSTVT